LRPRMCHGLLCHRRKMGSIHGSKSFGRLGMTGFAVSWRLGAKQSRPNRWRPKFAQAAKTLNYRNTKK
jgi:hypothetical protein